MRGVQFDHLLRVMIAVTILLATILLGVGERSATLTLVSLAALAISAYVTDARGLFRLRQSMANCVALGIVAVSAVNAYEIDRHGQLLAVADLQSYLQYVLLFQSKTPRVYWQLALLSLGQVAIASTLVPGPLFGVMLLWYSFAAIVTFALLLLHRESKRFEMSAASISGSQSRAGFHIAQVASRNPVLFGNSAPLNPRAIGWGLLGQSVLISSIAVAVAAALFFLLPRWDIKKPEVASREPLRSVGFSKTVTLGELGEVIRNPDRVMRIEFFHDYDNESFKLIGEPLLRGTVVSRYENREWRQMQSSSPMTMPVGKPRHFVRQKITAEPLDAGELCCVFPVFAIQVDQRLQISTHRDQLMRQEDFRNVDLQFEVGTTGIANNTQRKIVPCETRLAKGDLGEDGLLQMPQGRTSLDDPFAGLRATAARELREMNVDPQDHLAAALALNDYFSGSGQFHYSLDAQQRDPSIDPLEDFVTKHPVGHCEYFAGALVMMLRSQGIPARMAIGFKGGEWNSLGKYYQVQQLHAHAWVEVYLNQRNVVDAGVSGEDLPPDAWLTLDPTEGTQERDQTAANLGVVARWNQYLDYARVLWTNYVAGLNARRQEQNIYQPLAETAGGAAEMVVSPQAWRARWRALGNSRLGAFWEWYRRHWFSWRGGLVAVGFSLFVIALGWAVRAVVGVLRRLGLVAARRYSHERPVLEMYRRLEAALGQRGLRRHPAQTAYEFASAAGADLAESIEHRRVAHLPRRIVDVFYRVRFGGRTLDNLEADAVEHALVELERAIGGRGRESLSGRS